MQQLEVARERVRHLERDLTGSSTTTDALATSDAEADDEDNDNTDGN